MKTFHLQIVTPKGLVFRDEARSVTVRTAAGDVGILTGHADYTAPIFRGEASVTDKNGDRKTAKCEGGIINVSGGEVSLIADEFEWER